MGGHLSDGGWLTQVAHQVAHAFDHPNAPLSEGGVLAVVVQVVPGKRDWKRVGKDSPNPLWQSAVRRRPASHGAAWRRTGGGGSGGSDPLIFAAGAPRAGGKVAKPLDTFPPLVFGGRSLHSDPLREGHRAPFRAHGRCVWLYVAL